jgi:hypothetical protein
MGLVLTKIEDPRDSLGKATRDELWDFAKVKGAIPDMVSYLSKFEWTSDQGFRQRTIPFVASQATATKEEMENYLRNRGMVNVPVAIRCMGRPTGQFVEGNTLMDQPSPVPVAEPAEATSVDKMSIQELRQECRSRGIKMARTDNIAKLRDKLR